ncbi:MAG: sulfate ABC transporter permease subunit CysW [Lachnospiraceae bacterium]
MILEQTHQDSKAVRWILIAVSIFFLVIMLVFPVVLVLTEALKRGWNTYIHAISDQYTIKALQLTITATVIAVLTNTVFGLFAAWLISKFDFRGKRILTTCLDIPFAVSPVIAGLIFIMTFGRIGWMNGFLTKMNIQIVFAVPGVILATIFVTLPFISREIIPVMNTQKNEEEAAALMGAKGFYIFRKVTFPHIKWALLYGIILCTARAMGEFGAVSVLSGHLRGKTNTLPLHVEILYNEFNYTQAFAVSSILVVLSIVILIIRNIVEYKGKKEAGL